jgi:glycerol-3-phosphate acyltransferase PlsX
MRIVVDAMGGDHAPAVVVEGAVLAAREFGVEIILTGREDEVQRS